MAKVEIQKIVAHYDKVVAVDDVSFSIERGEFVTLLGPSGCGKSSTLRIVAGLLRPSSGRVLFDNRDVTALSSSRRNIGMVFQSLALFPHMTVAENVAFGLKMRKVPLDEQVKRVRHTLDIVHLAHLAGRYPAQMSGGQQQRVALARALVIAPSILILDEPFGALDRKLREAMQVELHRLTRELGITALFVTHDQEEALMLSDAVAVMNKGAIEQYGRPNEIYARPRTQFVADFMGVTNFLPGRLLEATSAQTSIAIGDAIFRGPATEELRAGEAVSLAVRPEKVEMTTNAQEGGDGTDGALGGRVAQVTYHGNSSRYIIEFASGMTLVALENSDRRSGELAPGTPVWARWRPEDIHIFRA